MKTKMKTKIVFTTGCFDLFHIGHLNFLEQAAALGDRLIVGVQGDEWMRESKGIEPIIPLYQRLRIVSSLKCVDVAFPIHGPKDEAGVKLLNADIRVISTNHGYLPEHQPLREKMEAVGVEYVVLPRTPNISATEIKEKCYGELKSNAGRFGCGHPDDNIDCDPDYQHYLHLPEH